MSFSALSWIPLIWLHNLQLVNINMTFFIYTHRDYYVQKVSSINFFCPACKEEALPLRHLISDTTCFKSKIWSFLFSRNVSHLQLGIVVFYNNIIIVATDKQMVLFWVSLKVIKNKPSKFEMLRSRVNILNHMDQELILDKFWKIFLIRSCICHIKHVVFKLRNNCWATYLLHIHRSS